MAKADLTSARLRALLSYDPKTGEFRWLVSRPNTCIGAIAGKLSAKGYREIRVLGAHYRAQRLAFLYMNGSLPAADLVVDHINGERADNRWCNLRLLSGAENQQNRKLTSRSRTGRLGVALVKDKYFVANIRIKGVVHYLGCFKTLDAASSAYSQAKDRLHPASVL